MKKNNRICPYCGDDRITRVRRSSWMRIIPFSVLYGCRRCEGKYLIIFNYLKIMISKGHSRIINLINAT